MALEPVRFQVILGFESATTIVETLEGPTAELLIDKIILNGGGGTGGGGPSPTPTNVVLSTDAGQILEQRQNGLYAAGPEYGSEQW